jgi:hypothetical protein
MCRRPRDNPAQPTVHGLWLLAFELMAFSCVNALMPLCFPTKCNSATFRMDEGILNVFWMFRPNSRGSLSAPFVRRRRLARNNQHSINICHISISLISSVTLSCILKNFNIIYLTHMIFILNFVFTIVFYATRWIKLDLTCICFQKIIILTHCCFKSSSSIYSNW